MKESKRKAVNDLATVLQDQFRDTSGEDVFLKYVEHVIESEVVAIEVTFVVSPDMWFYHRDKKPIESYDATSSDKSKLN